MSGTTRSLLGTPRSKVDLSPEDSDELKVSETLPSPFQSTIKSLSWKTNLETNKNTSATPNVSKFAQDKNNFSPTKTLELSDKSISEVSD